MVNPWQFWTICMFSLIFFNSKHNIFGLWAWCASALHIMQWNPLFPPKTSKQKCEKMIHACCLTSSQLHKRDTLQSRAKREFLSLHPDGSVVSPSPSTRSGTWKPVAEPLPHCLLCLPLYSSTETCNSPDADPPVSFTSGQERWYNESI